VLRLNESKDNVDRAKSSLDHVAKISMDLYPRIELGPKIQRVQAELDNSKRSLLNLSQLLDRRSVHEHYMQAIRGLCGGGLFGLSLMLVASLISALILTILVCVDSHTWIYLTKK
jgi:protein tweety